MIKHYEKYEKRYRFTWGIALIVLSIIATLCFAGPGKIPSRGPSKSPVYEELDLPVEPPTGRAIKEIPYNPPKEDTEIEESPPTFNGEPIPTSNQTIVYVVDVSCSMGIHVGSYIDADGVLQPQPGGISRNRLDRAKAELTRSIRALPRSFHFNIIGFSCSMTAWRANSLGEATPQNKASAISFINNLYVNGGTGTGFAVAMALNNKQVMSVVLLTDGAPGCFAGGSMSSHRSMISNANTQHAIVTVFGIGASGLYRQFCQQVAADNNGSFIDIP